MRAEIGLPPPERRIGLAAHDFALCLAAPRVIVARAEKREGTPTVASRWLQRLRGASRRGGDGRSSGRAATLMSSSRATSTASSISASGRSRPPNPQPPVPARPRRLSVTEIETLVRDPYAIYAKHVLKLEPLDPLGMAPDYALRGSLIHEALGKFVADAGHALRSRAPRNG